MTKKKEEFRKCLILEFLGVVIINVTTAISLSHSPEEIISPETQKNAIISISLIIFLITTSFTPVSGGQFNPALTLPLILSKDISLKRGLLYILIQTIASIVSPFIIIFLGLPFQKSEIFGITFPFPTLNSKYYTSFFGCILEFTFTMYLVLVYYSCLRNRLSAKYFGLIVASGYLLGGIVIGHSTGGSLNVARSLGSEIVFILRREREINFDFIILNFGIILGGLLGGLLGNKVFHKKVNVLGIEYQEKDANGEDVSQVDSDFDMSFSLS